MSARRSSAARATPEQLAALAPLVTLSHERLTELAEVSELERAERGSDPLKNRSASKQSVFLLSGEILLMYEKGGSMVVVGGGDDAKNAINRRGKPLVRTKAITDVELVSIDDEVLDIMVTWDEVAAGGDGEGAAVARAARSDSRRISSVLSISNLRSGVFAQLPAAHIDELLRRFEWVPMRVGDELIREGDDGDYYYVVESGRCQVQRMVGGVKMMLAELKSGDAFGEEALVSEAKRNATVVALTDGGVVRLGKRDFDELLREPLLQRMGFAEASEKVRRGAVWLDVRYPSEYQYDKLAGAINVPLSEVRNMFAVLDRSKDYIVYCQSGRRSAAAAFLFAQRGFNVALLEGGLWGAERRR